MKIKHIQDKSGGDIFKGASVTCRANYLHQINRKITLKFLMIMLSGGGGRSGDTYRKLC